MASPTMMPSTMLRKMLIGVSPGVGLLTFVDLVQEDCYDCSDDSYDVV